MKLAVAPPDSGSKRFDLVGLGQNSVDLIAAVDEFPTPDTHQALRRVIRLAGGEIATATIACARLGWRACYVGTFGSDDHGDLIEGVLRREGVDVSASRRVDATNRMAIILVDRGGRRTVLWSRDPRLALAPADVDSSVITAGRVLLVDTIDVAASAHAAALARSAGIPTVVDVDRPVAGLDRLLAQIDILIASETFPATYTGATSTGMGLRRLAEEFRPALAVVTLGDEGSLALAQGIEIRTPAFPVDVVDTTGAGDAFRGGFIAAWLRDGRRARPDTLLEYANAAAALNCQALGAQAGLPTRDAVDALLTGADRVRSKYTG